jgi:catechol 2,3-dioxygenase-like lactoylglutathione lyase family enzyme
MPADMLVNIDVDDLDRAVAFYVAAFGLAVGRRFGAAAVELVGGTVPVYLLAKPAGTLASPASGEQRSYRRHWTPVHLDFVVTDLDAALAAALAAGATLDELPTTQTRAEPSGAGANVDWLIAELVALAGPAYFFLQVLTVARYRGRWRVAALVPLVAMVPLAVHAGVAYMAGAAAWPVLLILAAPPAFVYLVLVGVAKAVAASRAAQNGR